MAKVHTTVGPVSSFSVDARAQPLHARRRLLFVWLATVAFPWLLQVRSFTLLVMRHKITQNLIPPESAVVVAQNVTAHCVVQGLFMAGTWWNIYPTHYYTGDGIPSDSVFCHFLIPQYNMHGAYYIANRTVRSASTAPRSCAKAAKAVNYYFYHGSIGPYSYYDEGQGSYCAQDYIAYTITTGVGTTDMNFNKLAKFEGASGYHSSYYFGCVGIAWLAYRAIILMRSFVSCSQFAHRLDALHEPISLASSIVYSVHAASVSHRASHSDQSTPRRASVSARRRTHDRSVPTHRL